MKSISIFPLLFLSFAPLASTQSWHRPNVVSVYDADNQRISLDTIPNIRVDMAGNVNEVTIAINPVNTTNLAAGSNIDQYFFSTDGGYTWAGGRLSSTFGVAGDPSVVYDALGNLYYGHLSGSPTPGYALDRIVVQKSSNGGMNWSNGASIGYNPPRAQQDKEWLAADMTNSQFRNRLHVAWTQFDRYASTNTSDSTRILLSSSTDAGLTWSNPVRISDQAGNCLDRDSTVEGAVPAVGPNGEVYLAWSGPLGIVFDKSTDGGVNFGADVFVSSQPGGWDFSVPGLGRCNGLPITACDISNSRYRGTIYVGWSDQRNGLDNTDVFMAKSTNGGLTWSQARRVNDDTSTTHQFFCWMTVDQTTGNIYFVFYDRRNSVNVATDVFVARSTDGGDSFFNFKVSQSPFTPVWFMFLGDYINIAAHAGKVYPIWTRIDGNMSSMWIAIVNDSTIVDVPLEVEHASSFVLSQNYPNPFNPTTTIRYGLPHSSFVRLTVYNTLGQQVAQLVNDQQQAGYHEAVFHGDKFASSVYFYRLQTGGYVETRKMLLLR